MPGRQETQLPPSFSTSRPHSPIQLNPALKSQCIPTQYVCMINSMLSNHKTQLQFDDFTSDPIDITNSTTQGCPLSMLLYAFYNADLINIATGKSELSTRFINNCAFITVANSLDKAHVVLKNMMECTGSRVEWSLSHNSPFELSKLLKPK